MMIRVLDKNVSDKIAAGEVVERPVSIVKELVENSIDSGANRITVDIKNGGKSYIRVTDNGCGIPSNQVKTAFLRHATSKIRKAEDLDRIETLGFRGEALASIAAVTRTELITKTSVNKTGRRVMVHGSQLAGDQACGCPDGTTIIIEDLFYNTPARRKFLKSDGAEAGRIIDFMSQIALTEPGIRFNFINNGRNVFATSGKGNLLETILEVYKDSEYKDLVPVDHEENGIQVKGYISKPSLSRNSRRSQFFFVNGRVVKSKVIEKGLSEGYRERLFEGRYPVAYIFIETDPAQLDVNIHPNKQEIRFDDEAKVISAVASAVIVSLASDQAVATVEAPRYMKEKSSTNVVKESSFKMDTEKPKSEQVDITVLLSEKRRAQQILDEREEEKIDADIQVEEKRPVGISKVQIPRITPFDFQELQFVSVIFGTYILCQDSDTFYMIDQHAAHERVFYEKLMKEYENRNREGQLLMVPFTVDVPEKMAQDDEIWTGLLYDMGYGVELFGECTYIFREVPGSMGLSESQEFVKTFVDQFSQGRVLDNQVEIDRIITRSCKSAIKAHDKMSKQEAEELLFQMKQCRNPFSCPHGRPTFIKYSLYEIERMFKRA